MTPEEILRTIEKFDSSAERFTQSDPSRILLVELTKAVWELAYQAAHTNDLFSMRLLDNSAKKSNA